MSVPPLIAEEWEALHAGADVPGGFPYNASSNVLENARLVKAGAGRLYSLSVYSSKVAAQFIQLHDAASVPADGAVPVVVLTVATIANLTRDYADLGRHFYRGIVVCNSSTAATKTVGAADCWFDVQFA